MEINTKQLIALAAIGGAVWYFMRKGSSTSVTAATKPAVAPAAGSGGIWDGFGVGGNLAAAMGQVAATTNPQTTPDAVYQGQNKPLEIAPAPSSGGAVFGAGGGGGATFLGIKDGRRTWSDGSSEALTDGEKDLYNRGILGTHYGAYTAPAAAPAAAPSGGAVWGARA